MNQKTLKLAIKWVIIVVCVALASTFQTLGLKANIGLCASWDVLSLNLYQLIGIKVGYVSICCNCICLFLQFVILRRRFHPVRLLQLVTVFVYGMVCNVMYYDVFTFQVTSYAQRVGLLLISCVGLGFFIGFPTAINLVSTPAESLAYTVNEEFDVPYGRIRMGIDCTAIVLSLLISIFGGLSIKIREGTLITMFMLGPFTGMCMKWQKKLPFMKWLLEEE